MGQFQRRWCEGSSDKFPRQRPREHGGGVGWIDQAIHVVSFSGLFLVSTMRCTLSSPSWLRWRACHRLCPQVWQICEERRVSDWVWVQAVEDSAEIKGDIADEGEEKHTQETTLDTARLMDIPPGHSCWKRSF